MTYELRTLDYCVTRRVFCHCATVTRPKITVDEKAYGQLNSSFCGPSELLMMSFGLKIQSTWRITTPNIRWSKLKSLWHLSKLRSLWRELRRVLTKENKMTTRRANYDEFGHELWRDQPFKDHFFELWRDQSLFKIIFTNYDEIKAFLKSFLRIMMRSKPF